MHYEDMKKEDFLKQNNISEIELTNVNLTWDTLSEISNDYETRYLQRSDLSSLVMSYLQFFSNDNLKLIHSFRHRKKSTGSLLKKIYRKKLETPELEINSLNYSKEIKDLIGFRILHLTPFDWVPIDSILRKEIRNAKLEERFAYVREGDSIEIFKNNDCETRKHDFGYRSVHYIFKTTWLTNEYYFEVQVRTLFQEGWSEIDHKYKYPDTVDALIKDSLAVLNRISGMADEQCTFVQNLMENTRERSSLMEKQKSLLEKLQVGMDLSAIESDISQKELNELESSMKKVEKSIYKLNSGIVPKFKLEVRNIERFKTFLTFEIYLLHLNPEETIFEYAGGQYFFDFNEQICNEGNLTYTIIESELPTAFTPRNPKVHFNQLRLAVNTFPGAGNGLLIPYTTPGIKVVKMKLETSATEFQNVDLNLRWRYALPNPFTKIFAYIGTKNEDVSSPESFYMNVGHALPLPTKH